jgi:hypothetical protein
MIIRHLPLVAFVFVAAGATASAGFSPGGASTPGGGPPDYLDVCQMAFNPTDASHLYAVRYVYGWANSLVTRYDYSTATGQVSNPVTVATVPGAALGLAFFNNNLYLSRTDLSVNMGGIMRLQPAADGTYVNPVEFVNNIPTGLHQVDHLAVLGNTLYVGIGTQTDQGINNTQGVQESVYNGTVGVISDLTKVNYSAAGASNLPLGSVLTDSDPGKLHVFASGFRNPFGVFVANGQVYVSDNGADGPVTPDYLYRNVLQGSKGLFPTLNPGNPVSPIANLGLHTAVTGGAVIPSGQLQGDILLGLFHHDTSNPNPVLGNELVLVNGTTGGITAVTPLPASSSVTDVLLDATGRVILADYGPNFDNGNDPTSGGIYTFSLITPVPEPAALVLMVAGLPALGVAVRLARIRASRRD